VRNVRFDERVLVMDRSSVEIGAAAGPGTGQVTVLLVDDDRLVRGLLQQILEGAGYRVLEAAGGEEARLRAERHEGPIHLLLTDVVMPGMNGRVLAELIMAARPEMKVLIMSGYMDDAELRQSVRAGRLPFIDKPFLPEGLLSKVREVLEAGDAEPVVAERAAV
jgi:two-component system cell cycle sensor histidine kinase/response regulator CckA